MNNESSDVRAELSIDRRSNGSGTYLSLVGRGTQDDGYVEKVRITASGALSIHLARQVSDSETELASMPLSGVTYTPGDVLVLRIQVEGSSPTSLRAKVWKKNSSEPNAWQVSATDGTGSLQQRRGVGISAYVSSSATNVPVTLTADNLVVTTLPAGTANQRPLAAFTSSQTGLKAGFDASASKVPDGAITSYVWDFGDGATSRSGPTTNHTYAAAGSYDVTLTVTDDAAQTASVRQRVTVQSGIPATPPSPGLPTSIAATLDTSYPVPGGALFVATTGSDSNAGTIASPLATLRAALRKASVGKTIVVRGGVYRQGVADPGSGGYPDGTLWTSRLPSGITIQAYPHETVWFDGADVARGWVRDAAGWAIPWSTPTFCGAAYYKVAIKQQTSRGPCTHDDMLVSGSATGSPQMVFRNGSPVSEVDTPAKLTASSFYYDHARRVLHVGFDPSKATVEVTKRAQALAIHATSNLSIKGIGFRRYGTNEYTNATSGAVALNGSPGALIERSVFTQNAGGALLSWTSRSLTVRSSMLVSNGFNGMLADGSYSQLARNPATRDDILLESVRVDSNNTDGFGPNCKASCAAAGAKFAHMIGFTVRNSSFSYNGGNRASGFWCDMACTDGWIHNNTVIGNHRHGIVYEISDRGTIASNVVAQNGIVAKGSGMMVGSANTRIYNNTIVGNYHNVLIYDDDRPAGNGSGPNTANINFVNNIVTKGDANLPLATVRAGSASPAQNTTPSQFVKTFDYNAYHRPAGSARWLLNWEETAYTNQLFLIPSQISAARGKSAHDVQITTAPDPFFVDIASGNYRVRPGSPAYRTGQTLPADIATRLGVASHPVDRGALR